MMGKGRSRLLVGLASIGILLGSQATLAQDAGAERRATGGPVVVELFTSQGCAACPPADAAFVNYVNRPEVIALSLHVDYWDYLGWEDAFGDPQYTQRQKDYARAARDRMIYTPQVVVNGLDRLQGTRGDDINAMIARYEAEGPKVDLSLILGPKGKLAINASASAPLSKEAVVGVVRYLPSATVAIERGENEGRSVDYYNVVTEWSDVALWNGQVPLKIEATLTGDAPVVVILQETGPGRILAAAELR